MDLKVLYPLTVIDVETGGLNPQIDALMSIGLVSLRSGRELYLELFSPPGLRIQEEALKVNGFAPDANGFWDMNTQIPEVLAFPQVQAFFDDEPRLLAGQNPTFDLGFLRSFWKRNSDTPDHFGHRTFDLHTLGVEWILKWGKHIPSKNGRIQVNLDDILEVCGLSRPEGTHNALTDARMTAEAIIFLLSQ